MNNLVRKEKNEMLTPVLFSLAHFQFPTFREVSAISKTRLYKLPAVSLESQVTY